MTSSHLAYNLQTQSANARRGRHEAARSLYRAATDRSWLGSLWAALSGRSRALLDLGAVEANGTVVSSRNEGLQMVAVGQIQGSGSQGRCRDFDADFCPLQAHNKERWLSVAAARQGGAKLPPVQLIQVGDVYFVQDGHHRISVARALGQEEIEADVTVWQVAGPLPWQKPAATRPQPRRRIGLAPGQV